MEPAGSVGGALNTSAFDQSSGCDFARSSLSRDRFLSVASALWRGFRAQYGRRLSSACTLRNARRSHTHSRAAARSSKPRNTGRGRYACLLSWGNELRLSHGTASVTCYGTGRATRRNRSIEVRSIFFLSNALEGRAFLFASPRGRGMSAACSLDRSRIRHKAPLDTCPRTLNRSRTCALCSLF